MLEIHTNTNDPDYISRRDNLVKTMRKQNFLMEIGFYNEGGVKGKRGRKPAPSKRIERKANTNTYSPKRFTEKEIDIFWDDI